MDKRSRTAVFLGYTEKIEANKLLDVGIRKIDISKDVSFDETAHWSAPEEPCSRDSESRNDCSEVVEYLDKNEGKTMVAWRATLLEKAWRVNLITQSGRRL